MPTSYTFFSVTTNDMSVHVPFILNKKTIPTLFLQGGPIPSLTHVKYLGIILD